MKYSSLLYKHLLQTDFESKWINFVKNLFDSSGLTIVYNNQSNTNVKTAHLQVKQKLTDQFISSWKSNMQPSNKETLYNLFKYNHKYEEYLNVVPHNIYLHILKFRTANHKLQLL